MDKNLLKISDFSRKSGVSTKTLRKWHNKGILEAKVGINGYRYYKDSDIEKAKKLKIDCYRRRSEKKLLILYSENDNSHEMTVEKKISSLKKHEQYREYEILTMKYSKKDIESNEKVCKQILSRIHEKIFLVIDKNLDYEENEVRILLLGILKLMNITVEIIYVQETLDNEFIFKLDNEFIFKLDNELDSEDI